MQVDVWCLNNNKPLTHVRIWSLLVRLCALNHLETHLWNKVEYFSTRDVVLWQTARVKCVCDSPTVWADRLCGWPPSWSAAGCIWVRAGWGAYWKAACCSSTSWLQKWGRVVVRLPRSAPFWWISKKKRNASERGEMIYTCQTQIDLDEKTHKMKSEVAVGAVSVKKPEKG